MDTEKCYGALGNYRKAVIAYADAQLALMDAKAILEDRRAHMLVAGVPGKNEAEREAHMRLSLGTEMAEVQKCERDLILARAQLNIAEAALRVHVNLLKVESEVE